MASSVEPFYGFLGANIRDLRLARGFTQDKLGKRLHPPVTRASIANIEGGKQRLLAHTLVDLAVALDVGSQELLSFPAPDRGIEAKLREKMPGHRATRVARTIEQAKLRRRQ